MPEGISNYYLTQGVLGVTVLVLALVIIYMQRKLDKRDEAHALEVKALNNLLVQTIQAHAKDFQEMAKDNQDVMANTAHTVALFGEKIEVVKGRR